MRDVGYFLCMALDTPLRRDHEKRLLQRYLDGLARTGATAPDFAEAWAQYRLQASYTVPGSAPAVLHRGGRVPEQARYAAAFSARSFAAVEDLDAAGAMRHALGMGG
jgi:hypothetical protein